MLDNRPTRDQEFATQAAEYLEDHKAYEEAKKRAEYAKRIAEEAKSQVEKSEAKLKGFVGRMITSKNALIDGQLVRVQYCNDSNILVAVEDVIQ